jgi:hypothetical protein
VSDDDRLSAWLDGELDAGEAEALADELEADPVLAAELEDVARVRAILRSAADVKPRPGALDRIVAVVAADETAAAVDSPVPVVDLGRRRRVSRVAAIAAALAIIGAVVGGVGGSTTLPAVGDLVARHDAAASDAMPADSHPMPMDDVDGMGPAMPSDLKMSGAFHSDGGLLHLVYRDNVGSVVSVFRQAGETDVEQLPDGKVADMSGTEVWSSTVADMSVAVIDGDGFVWTVVGDDDHDPMMVAMMDDLPSRSPSLGDRLRDAADAVVRPWRLD